MQGFTLISTLYLPPSQFSQDPESALPIKVFPDGHEVILQSPSDPVNPVLHVQFEILSLPSIESEFDPQPVQGFTLVSSLYLPRSQSPQDPEAESPINVCPA